MVSDCITYFRNIIQIILHGISWIRLKGREIITNNTPIGVCVVCKRHLAFFVGLKVMLDPSGSESYCWTWVQHFVRRAFKDKNTQTLVVMLAAFEGFFQLFSEQRFYLSITFLHIQSSFKIQCGFAWDSCTIALAVRDSCGVGFSMACAAVELIYWMYSNIYIYLLRLYEHIKLACRA